MKAAKGDHKLLNTIIFIHTIVVVVGFCGLFLIFFPPFQRFFIWFYLIVVGSEIILLSNCPLTVLEDRLKSRLEFEREEMDFINRILKKNFGFTVPENLIRAVLLSYFLIAIYLFFN